MTSAVIKTEQLVAAVEGDPWVTSHPGCALVGIDPGYVVLMSATGKRGNSSKTWYTPKAARRLAALLLAGADKAEQLQQVDLTSGAPSGEVSHV